MFNRPRCRDWTALVSQQLRLRNLIQISGHNIECEPNSSIYFTLHLTSMSAPFFTSEKLETPKNAIWPEINCQSIGKSTAHSVCIRVWQRTITTTTARDTPPQNGLKKRSLSADSSDIVDKVLFLWGVYFSGLVPISKRTDVTLRPNSLVFHIHGGFFTSSACLLPDNVPKQLEHVGVVKTQQEKQQQQLLMMESMMAAAPMTENCDQIVLSRNSIINMEIGAKSTAAKSGCTVNLDKSQLTAESKLNSVVCGIISPKQLTKDAKSPAIVTEKLDPELLKVRYIEKNFYRPEIRKSYNVEKLLELQEKQRSIRYETDSAKKIMDKICMRSAFCLDLELIANKAMHYRPKGNPSMGRTLNRLLFQQTELPKPEVLLKAQEIRRKIEMAKFRCRMLVQERNQAHITIRQLEKKLGDISDATIEQEAWLMANYRGLSKDKEIATETNAVVLQQQEQLRKLNSSLFQRRLLLLRELKEIYCIQRDRHGIYRINGAALFNAKLLSEMTSSSDISVALGYAAHLTLMCSVILNCPLRFAILFCNNITIILFIFSFLGTQLFTKDLQQRFEMISILKLIVVESKLEVLIDFFLSIFFGCFSII